MSVLDNRLETLLAVYETRNFTLAAKKLNLTQPAVSQHIASLEKELDIRIFNRVGNSITPSPLGEILIKYARRMSSLNRELKIKIEDEKHQTSSLTIGITHSSEGNLVPDVLAQYALMRQGTSIKIISDSIKNLYDKLSDYEIDLAVVEGKIGGDKFSKVLLDADSLVAIMANDNPLAKKHMVSVADLRKEKLILRSSKSATLGLFTQQLSNIDLTLEDFNVVMEIDNTSAIKNLVKKNMGVSLLPRSVCYDELKDKSLTLLPIENMNMITEINLVFLKNFSSRYVIEELMELYRQIASI